MKFHFKNKVNNAGIPAKRIINEPTAALVALELANYNDTQKYALIYDLGESNFDVTLILIEDGIYEVMATSGDIDFGGKDFDERICGHLIKEFQKKNNKDLSIDKEAVKRLRIACEIAKIDLSTHPKASIKLDSLFEGLDFHTEITREKFEELNQDLFKSTLNHIERVLRDARYNKIPDEILLLGGSSNIPSIQSLISQYFNGKQVNCSINPQHIVALGASIQSAVICNMSVKESYIHLPVNIVPLSLGVETAGESFFVVLPRNTSIPCSQEITFTSFVDQQKFVEIKIFQGERFFTKNNNLLGKNIIFIFTFLIRINRLILYILIAKFILELGTPVARTKAKITIEFKIDKFNVFSVIAKEETSKYGGHIKEILVTSNNTFKLNETEIKKIIEEQKKNQESDNYFFSKYHNNFLVSSPRDHTQLDLLEKLKNEYESSVENSQTKFLKAIKQLELDLDDLDLPFSVKSLIGRNLIQLYDQTSLSFSKYKNSFKTNCDVPIIEEID